MKPLSFVVIGSGWRALFFARIAKTYPELFTLKYMLCRTEEKAAKMAAEYDIPTTTSTEVCDEAKPDFVVVAVSRPSLVTETKKWVQMGYPVLCETPAADTVEDLKDLWEMVQNGAKIQIAEQYHRYPILAAGLKAISDGKLADPYAVRLSMAHDYHGYSLIRRMLEPKEPMKLQLDYLQGKQYTFPVRETGYRGATITDGSVGDKVRSMVTLQFTNGKVAFYDFCGVQYHSGIRTRHVNVQGQDGEWNDAFVRYIGEGYQPVEEPLKQYLAPEYEVLNTPELVEKSQQWTPYVTMENAQDEYAIATMMLDMGKYIAGGKEVYPMAEALEDAYLLILAQEAYKNPDQKIRPQVMPWHVKE